MVSEALFLITTESTLTLTDDGGNTWNSRELGDTVYSYDFLEEEGILIAEMFNKIIKVEL